MTLEENEHKDRHLILHKMLDELVADYISQSGRSLSSTIMDLIYWSFDQTQNPTHNGTLEEAVTGGRESQ